MGSGIIGVATLAVVAGLRCLLSSCRVGGDRGIVDGNSGAEVGNSANIVVVLSSLDLLPFNAFSLSNTSNFSSAVKCWPRSSYRNGCELELDCGWDCGNCEMLNPEGWSCWELDTGGWNATG